MSYFYIGSQLIPPSGLSIFERFADLSRPFLAFFKSKIFLNWLFSLLLRYLTSKRVTKFSCESFFFSLNLRKQFSSKIDPRQEKFLLLLRSPGFLRNLRTSRGSSLFFKSIILLNLLFLLLLRYLQVSVSQNFSFESFFSC